MLGTQDGLLPLPETKYPMGIKIVTMPANQKGEKVLRTETNSINGMKYHTQSEIPRGANRSATKIPAMSKAIINTIIFLCAFVCMRN
jgi:hypothetical protein